jgi:hypothetical protein
MPLVVKPRVQRKFSDQHVVMMVPNRKENYIFHPDISIADLELLDRRVYGLMTSFLVVEKIVGLNHNKGYA